MTGAIDARVHKLIVILAGVKRTDGCGPGDKGLNSIFDTFDPEPAAVSSFSP